MDAGNGLRKKNRVNVARPVVILLSSGKKVHAVIASFTVDGMNILTYAPGEVNAVLTFGFSLTIEKQQHIFKVRGKIVHSYLQADKYQSAIKFVEIDAETKTLFAKFINEINSKRIW